MLGQAEGLACTDQLAKTPISVTDIGPIEVRVTSEATSVGNFFWYFGPSGLDVLHRTNKNFRIPIPKKFGGARFPHYTMGFLGGKVGYFETLSLGSQTLDMTSEGGDI